MRSIRLCLHLLSALFVGILTLPNSLAIQTEAVLTRSALPAGSSSGTTTTTEESHSRRGVRTGSGEGCLGSAQGSLVQPTGTLKRNCDLLRDLACAVAAKSVGSSTALLPVGERSVLRQGEFAHRVFDSRYRQLGSQVSGPLGRSFSPGSGVPTTAAEATSTRGLGIFYPNNASEAVIFRAKTDIPIISRTAIGGTDPEILIEPQYWDQLELMLQYTLPGGAL